MVDFSHLFVAALYGCLKTNEKEARDGSFKNYPKLIKNYP